MHINARKCGGFSIIKHAYMFGLKLTFKSCFMNKKKEKEIYKHTRIH